MESLTNQNLVFAPKVVLSSFLPCTHVLMCPDCIWVEGWNGVVLMVGQEHPAPAERKESYLMQCVDKGSSPADHQGNLLLN